VLTSSLWCFAADDAHPFYAGLGHLTCVIRGHRPYLIEERLLQLLLLRLELGQVPLLQDRHPAGSKRVSHMTDLRVCHVGDEGTTE
jgi:hypothetical protein